MSGLKEVVIVSAARTPVGSFGGVLKDVPATKLGSIAIKGALEKGGVPFDQVDEVIMGNVLQANEGQAPARQAALGAGLDTSVACMTINKVCGSGLKSVMLAAQAIMVGDAEVIVAGGMENMSQVPYYLPKARYGYRMGHGELVDGMIKDGLWDVYNDFHMGIAAELCASECNVPREAQDEYATMSYKRALKAQEEGLFNEEIVPVEVPQRKGDPIIVSEDEEPKNVKFEKIPHLRPAFKKDGTVTAANASKINDGAAAVVVMSLEKANELGLKPMARIVSQASFAKKPEYFTTAPADSINLALKKAGLTVEDIDLFEINEAFAVVAIINNRLLNLPVEKVNVHGGAVAIGHPIGASGTRILTTLLYAMKHRSAKRGLASLCIGGGEASTLVVELM
ncbi:acetyl-CoA acetyltransferase [Caldithrix abyssi DSM 13497]|uniref:Acetyl-CoA C-acetyltransferase n=1 Tax=Caldithrix abyssi DSM 13497 TaxID=880073 RepID=H1XNS7_CALAY|nr:acetyl-CoA C-acetyltransferase [Caldithrix abyssi]APF19762.1 acetyl-CoA C-acetyltransferase [Caldithrix abyssi DSM 13497]EHO39867.1 acetyl-CoA acetyltransferase [Caldithrix abyssi DSM 13497]